MAENSNIEWTDHTFNPWVGCAKVSAGCKNCYAETLMDTRYGRVKWGVNGTRSKTAPGNWKQPLKWNNQRYRCTMCGHWQKDGGQCVKQTKTTLLLHGIAPIADTWVRCEGVTEFVERPRVFCSSLADVFEDRPELTEWRTELFKLIDATPHLDWLLLTKRPENIQRMWREVDDRGWLDDSRPNVWLGTSVEDQAAANARIPELLKAAHLCRFTFLSCEPLLGPVDLLHVDAVPYGGPKGHQIDCIRKGYWSKSWGFVNHSDLHDTFGPLHWVIAGGESGPCARPMHPDWARSLRDQCEQAGVPFLFKQWGEWMPVDEPWKQESPRSCADNECWLNLEGGAGFHGTNVWRMRKVGKHKAGRMLDGVEHNGFPTS